MAKRVPTFAIVQAELLTWADKFASKHGIPQNSIDHLANMTGSGQARHAERRFVWSTMQKCIALGYSGGVFDWCATASNYGERKFFDC